MRMGAASSIVLLGLMAAALPAKALNIGDSIVDTEVKMKNVDGKMVSLNEAKGKMGTLVIFSCVHCPFVKGWQDTMVDIANTYQKKGFGVVFINSNDPDTAGDGYEAMQALAKEKKYTFPFVVDSTSDVARHFGATKTPDVFLFDAKGKLVYKGAVGEGSQTPKEGGALYLRDALDALLTGKPIPKAESKAVGCTIKFREPAPAPEKEKAEKSVPSVSV
ncbi:MAG: thioredoxin family protein [Pontiellaceae bacterium]|nr:thioredoxin family protein [Pontiellaceae bacterium]